MSTAANSPTPELILSIDLGSTWCKAALIDADGRFHSEGRASTVGASQSGSLFRSHWDSLVLSVQGAIQGLEANHDGPGSVVAINFSCRGLIGIALDRQQQPFVLADEPAMLGKFRDTSSMTGSLWERDDSQIKYGYASRLGSLIEWVRSHQPETIERIWRVGCLRDWIAWKLTGNWVTCQTMGPGQPTWPNELIEQFGLADDARPAILGPSDRAGNLTDQAARELGLPAGVAVFAGMHDGSAANVGVGAVHPGTVCLTLGTNLSLRAVNGPRLYGAFCYVIVPERWAWVDNAPNAAGRLDCAARVLSTSDWSVAESHRQLGLAAGNTPPGCAGYQLPVLPPRDTEAFERGLLHERSIGLSPEVLYRAVVEQIAFEVGLLLARARRSGASATVFIGTGGGLRNQFLTSVVASVIGEPIVRGEPEAGLLGAAITASVGLGWHESIDAAVNTVVRQGDAIDPVQPWCEPYQQLWYEWAVQRFGRENLP